MNGEAILGVLLAWVAGLAILAGGVLARIERIRPAWLESELRHGVIAFGGGALLAAVALVLVPDGREHLPTIWVAFWFCARWSSADGGGYLARSSVVSCN